MHYLKWLRIATFLAIGFLPSTALAQRSQDIQACINVLKDGDERGLNAGIAGCTAIIERGRRLRPGVRAEALNQRGRALTAKRDYAGAIRDFDEALRINSKSGTLYNNRGWAYLQKGDYRAAIRDYDESIRLDS